MPDYVAQLENLGIPVVILAPKDVNGVISDITLVGKITGAASQAKTLTTSMQNSLNTIETKIKGVAILASCGNLTVPIRVIHGLPVPALSMIP